MVRGHDSRKYINTNPNGKGSFHVILYLVYGQYMYFVFVFNLHQLVKDDTTISQLWMTS